MARYTPLFYRGSPASIPQVVAHIQRTLTEEDPDYTPLRQRMPPASIPEIVAHIQEYLAENVFVTVEDLGEDIAAYIEAHPDIVGVLTVNGSTGNVTLDASDIPIETGEDPTVAGAISYLSSQLALLVAGAVLSVNGVDPDDSHDVTLTGAEIPQDGNTLKKLSETFGPATSSTAGSKGLVPAPAAGDENRVLSGAGTWVVNQSAGGVSSVCNVEPNAQGNVPLMGSNIPLQSMSLQTVSQAIEAVGTAFTGATSSTAGTKGQVPAPAAGDEDKVLSGGGTWVTPASGTVKQVCSVSPDAQGNVALTGSNVPTSPTDNNPISTTLSSLNDQIGNLANLITVAANLVAAINNLDFVEYSITPRNNAKYATTNNYKNKKIAILSANVYWDSAITIQPRAWFDVGQLPFTLPHSYRNTYLTSGGVSIGRFQISQTGLLQIFNESGTSALTITELYINGAFGING